MLRFGRWCTASALLCTSLISSACAPVNQPGGSETMRIAGAATYRERIAAPVDARLIVTMSDISRADAAAIELAQQEIDLAERNVPVDFDLQIDPEILEPGHRYAVRASIRNSEGGLLWTTDTTYPVPVDEGESVDLGMLVMKRVGDGPSAGATADPSLLGEWVVEDIDGRGVIDNSRTSLTFGDDGSITGLAGCNRYRAEYTASDGMLQTGMAAVTSMACVPALADQEQRFLDLFGALERYSQDPTGALHLVTADARRIVARRP
ncbi:MAG: YbaY family lipoprotein [Geminicoccaceae bacterium]